MPTLILTPRFTDDAQSLWRAAVKLGWTVHRLPNWRVPEHIRDCEEPVLYLEGLLGPTLAEQFGLQLTEVPENWLVALPHEFKLRNVRLTTLGEARKLESSAFVKPPNDKSFPARPYLGRDLPLEYDDSSSVLVSDIVAWESEFRCFVLDRELKTFSVYLRNGELQKANDYAHTSTEQETVCHYMDELLARKDITIPKASVIDIGKIDGIGWAVVEMNAAWGSGIYGCEPSAVLDVLRHASTKMNA